MINRENTPVVSAVPPNFRESVTLRIKAASSTISKGSGNPQVVVVTEVVKPLDYKATDGKTYVLDSQELSYYFPMKVGDDIEKTKKAQDKYLSFLEILGLPAEFDPANPIVETLVGICFQTVLGSIEDIPQKRNEKGEYVAILGGDGKPIKSNRWKWVNYSSEIQGRVEMETAGAGKPY